MANVFEPEWKDRAVSTMVYPEVVEMLDSDKILAQSAPPGVADRIALAFPRAAQVDRLAGEPGASRHLS